MAQRVEEVMTTNPTVCGADATVKEASTLMRDRDIGDVLVEQDGHLRGVVTDRDIVIRAIAEGADPGSMKLGDICSGDVITLRPQDSLDEAVKIMREKAIRRIPIVDGDRPVGIISIGDLAIERDGHSALADISAAPGNT